MSHILSCSLPIWSRFSSEFTNSKTEDPIRGPSFFLFFFFLPRTRCHDLLESRRQVRRGVRWPRRYETFIIQSSRVSDWDGDLFPLGQPRAGKLLLLEGVAGRRENGNAIPVHWSGRGSLSFPTDECGREREPIYVQ